MAKVFAIGVGKLAFAKNVFTVMSGRTLAVSITFLLTPVIARLFDPRDWGVAVLFLALSTTIGPMSCFRYEKAIPVAKEQKEANRLAVLSSFLTFSIAVLVLCAAGALQLSDWRPEMLTRMGLWIWLLPLGVLLEGHAMILEAWLTRAKRFASQASGEVLQALTRTSTRIAYGSVIGSAVSGLIGSYLLAYTAKVALLLSYSRSSPKLEFRLEPAECYSRLATQYGDFPKYNAPTALLMRATKHLPVFVLAALFDPVAVGLFGMADRVVRTPAHISSNSVRKVFLQKIAEIWNAGRPIRRQTLQTTAALGAAGVVPCAVLWVFGQEIITFVLGTRWGIAGRYCEILAPLLFVQWLTPPFQGAAMVMGAQRLWFFLHLFAAASRLLVIPVAFWGAASAETIIEIYVWISIVAQSIVLCVVATRLDGRSKAAEVP